MALRTGRQGRRRAGQQAGQRADLSLPVDSRGACPRGEHETSSLRLIAGGVYRPFAGRVAKSRSARFRIGVSSKRRGPTMSEEQKLSGPDLAQGIAVSELPDGGQLMGQVGGTTGGEAVRGVRWGTGGAPV